MLWCVQVTPLPWQKCHRGDQMEGDPDHMLRFLCGGACRGNLYGDFIALEHSSSCISLRWPLWYCLRIDSMGCKNTVFSSHPRRRQAFLRRSTSHLPKASSSVFLASSYFPSPRTPPDHIVLPSNRISRYARNRPPLSCYHARQAVAQKA